MFDIITMHMELFAEEIMSKIYVEVEAVFGENGTLRPNCVHWKDGRKFVIDKSDCFTFNRLCLAVRKD